MIEEQVELQQMGMKDILKKSIKLYEDNFALFLKILLVLWAQIKVKEGCTGHIKRCDGSSQERKYQVYTGTLCRPDAACTGDPDRDGHRQSQQQQ